MAHVKSLRGNFPPVMPLNLIPLARIPEPLISLDLRTDLFVCRP